MIVGHSIATIVITIASLLLIGPRDTFQVRQKPDSQTVKAIYVTAYTAGNKARRSELVDLINKTELNAVVIDLKDYSGRIFLIHVCHWQATSSQWKCEFPIYARG